ncbi:MAG: cyclic nucleotide-binding domain-containing protein [Acidobacteriia bacterium]|nr:cyclic nucleotide-binding domain-containing protein [Terriglobia bacterium]
MRGNSALQLRQNSSNEEWIEGDGADGPAKRDSIELEVGSHPVFFPKGGTFFLEGQSATGIFLLRFGRAKESMVSSSGRIAIVRVIGPGVILGLTAVLTGAPHESTVETLEPSHADFLAKPLFLHLLKTSSRWARSSQASSAATAKRPMPPCAALAFPVPRQKGSPGSFFIGRNIRLRTRTKMPPKYEFEWS